MMKARVPLVITALLLGSSVVFAQKFEAPPDDAPAYALICIFPDPFPQFEPDWLSVSVVGLPVRDLTVHYLEDAWESLTSPIEVHPEQSVDADTYPDAVELSDGLWPLCSAGRRLERGVLVVGGAHGFRGRDLTQLVGFVAGEGQGRGQWETVAQAAEGVRRAAARMGMITELLESPDAPESMTILRIRPKADQPG